ncbi:hypothetical protein [Streptomyces sp. 8L]|uniref:hypothetical protein n=1 Tax=Streptomyces sp. 8L TaxID=2877242 RepID=UPI001CD4C57F|nr:hypothetical protein [Streptomyces sp. 8L]MCA1220618.1 hypothetical protein [Streptomyces sp. 8L]
MAGVCTLLVLGVAQLIYSAAHHGKHDGGGEPGGAQPPVHVSVTVVEHDHDDGIDWPSWVTAAGTIVTPIIVALLTYQLGRRTERRDAARRAADSTSTPSSDPANLPAE